MVSAKHTPNLSKEHITLASSQTPNARKKSSQTLKTKLSKYIKQFSEKKTLDIDVRMDMEEDFNQYLHCMDASDKAIIESTVKNMENPVDEIMRIVKLG